MRYRSYQGFTLSPIWVLIIINFLFLVASYISDRVVYQLGLVPALFLGRPWTVFTNLFVHAGFWHFFGNMITLYFFGTSLSRLVGDRKFLIVYFVGGILGNFLYLLLGAPNSVIIGASGAVYAVAGALVVLVPKLRVLMYFVVPMPLWVVVLIFFVLWSFVPGVAWQAHIGGLVTGLVAGYIFKRRGRYYY